MTTELNSDAAVAAVPPRRRRTWPRIAMCMLVLALFGAGIAAVVYARTYQPLSGAVGGGFGPATSTVAAISDGIEDTNYILVGPTGTTGVVSYTIGNVGRFAVRILGLSPQGSYGVTGVRWSDESEHNPGNGAALGLVSESHSFPMTLQPNETIFLQVSVRKFDCVNGGAPLVSGVALRWTALHVRHVWTLRLQSATVGGPDGADVPIVLCPSRSALAHIDAR
ncbi:MAG TPA: hypothetical protein VME70_13395 [Mycobacteriales bacterium]|nr:hypothetical protein [Mycobacteriales bacterium]